jgi:hypothetical protein
MIARRQVIDSMAASVVLDPSRPLKRVYYAHIQHSNVSNESLPELQSTTRSARLYRESGPAWSHQFHGTLEKLKLMTNGLKLGQERGF